MLEEVKELDLVTKIIDLSKTIDYLQINPNLIDFVKLSLLFKNKEVIPAFILVYSKFSDMKLESDHMK